MSSIINDNDRGRRAGDPDPTPRSVRCCGAEDGVVGYRCTLPADHEGEHLATARGQIVSTWE